MAHLRDWPGTWRSAAFAPELNAGFPEQAKAVQAAGGELTAAGIQGQYAIARDARAAFDEGAAVTLRAKSPALQPDQGEDAETVI